MRLVAAAITLLLLTGSAHAQINLWGADGKPRDPEAEAKQEALDKAYRAKLQAIPAKPAAVNDPWGNVRATETPQNKTQTGSKNR